MGEKKIHRILIVEDSMSSLNVLCRVLMPIYDIIVAQDGKSAVQKAETHMPDLILLDVILPDMTGFEVISVLKNSDVTRNIPVIFITGLDDAANEERGLLLGAVDYITKPFHNSIMKARIGNHLRMVEYVHTIEHLCRVDALTNISNRRCFDDQLMNEWERAARNKKQISLLLIDIDGFKVYNDTYGHQQGDILLRVISETISVELNRPTDSVFRWGGDEFAVLLSDTDLEGALEVAERIRKRIDGIKISKSKGINKKITVSIGVSSMTPDGVNSIEDFVSKVDEALYSAKNSGRNCVRSIL